MTVVKAIWPANRAVTPSPPHVVAIGEELPPLTTLSWAFAQPGMQGTPRRGGTTRIPHATTHSNAFRRAIRTARRRFGAAIAQDGVRVSMNGQTGRNVWDSRAGSTVQLSTAVISPKIPPDGRGGSSSLHKKSEVGFAR